MDTKGVVMVLKVTSLAKSKATITVLRDTS